MTESTSTDPVALPLSTQVIDQTVEEDGGDLFSFLSQFSGGTNQFVVFRQQPATAMINGKSRKVSGHLETFQEPPTLDTIREVFGGGRYEVRVMGPLKGQRGHRILHTRRFEIAGDPKLRPEALVDDDVPPPPLPSPLPDNEVARERREVIEQLRDDRRRSDELLEKERQARQEERASLDRVEARLALIEANAQAKVESVARDLAQRDRELAELRKHVEAPRPSMFSDPDFLKLTFDRSSQDLGRLMDAQHGELSAERERCAREIGAANERASRDLERAKEDRQASIHMLEKIHANERAQLDSKHEQLLASKENEIARLNETVRELRARKDQDITDQVAQVGKLKTLFEGLGGGQLRASERDEEPPDWMEKVSKYGAPLMESLGRGLSTIAKPQPAQPPRMIVPRQMWPVRPGMPGGAFAQPMMVRPVGMHPGMVPFPQPPRPMMQVAPVLNPPANAQAPTPTSPPAPEAESPISLAAIQEGMNYVEMAFQNRLPPEIVATSIRTQFPRSLIDQLVSLGGQAVYAHIERTMGDSGLATIGGRRFILDLVEKLGADPTVS